VLFWDTWLLESKKQQKDKPDRAEEISHVDEEAHRRMILQRLASILNHGALRLRDSLLRRPAQKVSRSGGLRKEMSEAAHLFGLSLPRQTLRYYGPSYRQLRASTTDV
jgi:hypothetical protein